MTEEITMRTLGKQALEQHENDWEAAVGSLVEILESDPKIRRVVANEALRSATRNEVQLIGRGQRQRYWHQNNLKVAVLAEEKEVVYDLRKGEESKLSPMLQKAYIRKVLSWMDYPMLNGKRYGQCTKREIYDDVFRHRRLEKTHGKIADVKEEGARRLKTWDDKPDDFPKLSNHGIMEEFALRYGIEQSQVSA